MQHCRASKRHIACSNVQNFSPALFLFHSLKYYNLTAGLFFLNYTSKLRTDMYSFCIDHQLGVKTGDEGKIKPQCKPGRLWIRPVLNLPLDPPLGIPLLMLPLPCEPWTEDRSFRSWHSFQIRYHTSAKLLPMMRAP